MQQVISREKEPITPFLERGRDLYEKAGVSTILVAGSSGAFFYIADHIIQMDCYKPVEITEQVKALCKEHQAPRVQAPGFAVPAFAETYAAGRTAGTNDRNGRSDRSRGGRGGDRAQERSKVKTFGRDSFSIDRETVDLRYVEQLADSEQTSALAYLTCYALEQLTDGRKNLRQIAAELRKRIETKGWDGLTGSYVPCGLAKPRIQEIFAALNRYRG